MQEVKRMPARCSRPDNLAFSSPTLATLTLLTQRVLCPRRASEKAPDNSTLLPRSARLTRSILWVLASHRVCHPPNFLSDGLRSSSAHRTSSNCLCYPHTFPPHLAWLTHSMSWVSISHRMLREPSQFRVFSSPYSSARLSIWQRSLDLMSDVDAGLPVGSYACHPQVTLIHSMPWVLISRWMSWEPPCWTSQTLFICKPIGPTCPMTRYCALVGGFMGPLDQIPPSVLWLAGADGQ